MVKGQEGQGEVVLRFSKRGGVSSIDKKDVPPGGPLTLVFWTWIKRVRIKLPMTAFLTGLYQAEARKIAQESV